MMALGMIFLTACGGGKSNEKLKIAYLTDDGNIDDGTFNGAIWSAIAAYCEENGCECDYYRPQADSDDARTEEVKLAVDNGANLVILGGSMFAAIIPDIQDKYPDTKFIAMDISADDIPGTLKENVFAGSFREEEAGYLAGYAAVAEGYSKLGFLGGIDVTAVKRFGYGYVQGADEAAKELEKNIEIKYTYGGQFFADSSITSKMMTWYEAGTEVVFSCGGGIYESVLEAALANNGMMIGVDVDQYYVGKKCSYNPFLTSAMKNLGELAVKVIEDYTAGNWSKYAGQALRYGISDSGSYVGLPTTGESWVFKTFTLDKYNEIVGKIVSGELIISDEINGWHSLSEYTAIITE